MLKDITLGQFFPGTSLAHRLDPRTKIVLVVLYIVALFQAKNLLTYALVAVTFVTCARVSKVGARALLKGLKPVVIIVLFTGFLNLFFTPGETLYAFELGEADASAAAASWFINGAATALRLYRLCAENSCLRATSYRNFHKNCSISYPQIPG